MRIYFYRLAILASTCLFVRTTWGQEPGDIVTIAGGSSDGGLAVSTNLNAPRGVFVDTGGNVYIADTVKHRVRKITPDGRLSTVAGDGFTDTDGAGRFTGDNGPAVNASLNFPTDVALDNTGSVYIVDSSNHRIRIVAVDGVITTMAGDGFNNTDGAGRLTGDNGPAVSASLNFPRGIFVDQNRSAYIADTFNHRIRRVIGQGAVAAAYISLTAFSAAEEHGMVRVLWTTDQPSTQSGFNLYRSLRSDADFVKINPSTITGETSDFQYLDREGLEADQTYYYEVEVIDLTGSTERFGPVSVQIDAVTTFELFQNAPNPFNPETIIRYALPAASRVMLRIYNTLGQEVVTLLDGVQKPAGYDAVRWNGLNHRQQRVASGIYIYRITTDTGFTQTRRMLLLR